MEHKKYALRKKNGDDDRHVQRVNKTRQHFFVAFFSFKRSLFCVGDLW